MNRVKPSRPALELARLFVPGTPLRQTGRSGERLGSGVGASLEFEDRRNYAPGDDLRHVDWRALARTGEVMVRVHREEVQPRLDVLLDTSRSMATEPEKAQRAVDLAALFAGAGLTAGHQVRCHVLDEVPRRVEFEELCRVGVAFDQRANLGESLGAARAGLLPGSMRICISDFLSEHPPGLDALAAGSGRAGLVQVLGPWEADPVAGERHKLVDARSAMERDLSIDATMIRGYKRRLERLIDELVEEGRRLGMGYCQVLGSGELEQIAREVLIPSGFLELE